MKFKKLNDDRIKCVISRQEMEENGIEIGDFLTNQDSTRDFIRDILAQACKALEIEPKGKAYSVQMTVLPDGDLSLIISPDAAANLKDALDILKKQLAGLSETIAGGEEDKEAPLPQYNGESLAQKKQATEIKPGQISYGDTPLWCVLPSVESAINMCRELPKFQGVVANLYKYQNEYYMSLRFNLSKRETSGIILVVAEYSTTMFTEDYDGAYIAEQGKLLVADCLEKFACM